MRWAWIVWRLMQRSIERLIWLARSFVCLAGECWGWMSLRRRWRCAVRLRPTVFVVRSWMVLTRQIKKRLLNVEAEMEMAFDVNAGEMAKRYAFDPSSADDVDTERFSTS